MRVFVFALLGQAVWAQKGGNKGGGTTDSGSSMTGSAPADDDWSMAYSTCSKQSTSISDGSCNSSPSDSCSTCGGSSDYDEVISIDGTTRKIRASGCPNNNPMTNCLGDNPNMAAEHDTASAEAERWFLLACFLSFRE